MIQPDLFNVTPAPSVPCPSPAVKEGLGVAPNTDRRGKRDTSRDAHRTLRDTGKLSAREHEVYALLCRHPERDFTRAEIAKALGRTHGSICGRAFSLREYGLIVETPRRRCSVTGAESHGLRCK